MKSLDYLIETSPRNSFVFALVQRKRPFSFGGKSAQGAFFSGGVQGDRNSFVFALVQRKRPFSFWWVLSLVGESRVLP